MCLFHYIACDLFILDSRKFVSLRGQNEVVDGGFCRFFTLKKKKDMVLYYGRQCKVFYTVF